jgi:hypothetical protein
MIYKIVITCPEKSTAEKVYRLIAESKLYQSSEIMHLQPIKEVCDECARRE